MRKEKKEKDTTEGQIGKSTCQVTGGIVSLLFVPSTAVARNAFATATCKGQGTRDKGPPEDEE